MDEEIERLIVSVRADTQGFARDVTEMRGALEGPFAAGVDRAGRAIETGLARAIRTGKLGFDDLAKVALSALAEIAAAGLKVGLDGLFGAAGGGEREDSGKSRGGGWGGGGIGWTGGLGDGIGALIAGLSGGAPGRATGGPVSPDRPYWVGERGPELFVPAAAGSVLPNGGGTARDVRVAITVNARGDEAPQALAASSRQVARAVRAALAE